MPIKPYATQPVAPYTAPNLRCGMVLRVIKDIGQVSKVGDYLVVGYDTTTAINVTRGTRLYTDAIRSRDMWVLEVTLQEVQQ